MTIKDTPEEWEIRATQTPFVGNKTSVRTDDVDASLDLLEEAGMAVPPSIEREARRLQDEGKTVVLTTHNMSDVDELCASWGSAEEDEAVEETGFEAFNNDVRLRALKTSELVETCAAFRVRVEDRHPDLQAFRACDLAELAHVDIDGNGLSRCIAGELVYEPDVTEVPFPVPQRLARGGLRAFVAAPLRFEGKTFGVLIVGRRRDDSFSSGDCETFRPLLDNLLESDPFLVLADFASYVACQNEVDAAWADTERWTRMSITNTAHSGRFSSDRAIREFMPKDCSTT